MGLKTENVEKVFVLQHFLTVASPTDEIDPEDRGSF